MSSASYLDLPLYQWVVWSQGLLGDYNSDPDVSGGKLHLIWEMRPRKSSLSLLPDNQTICRTHREKLFWWSFWLFDKGLKHSKNDSINTWHINVFNKMITFSLTSSCCSEYIYILYLNAVDVFPAWVNLTKFSQKFNVLFI